MGFFRRGFWQKLIIYLTVILEFVLFVLAVVAIVNGYLNTDAAVWTVVILWAINFVCGIVIVQTNAEDSYKIAWLFIVGMLPIIGPLMYLVLAHKYRSLRQKKYFSDYFGIIRRGEQDEAVIQKAEAISFGAIRTANYLRKATDSVLYDHSAVTYYPFGDDMFQPMLEDLRKAKHFIFIEYFIITPGKMWDSILEILKRKAKEGVDVRVIWDDIGNVQSTPVLYDKELKKLGIKAHVYGRVKPFIDVRYSQRDHRKIMVIDGHTAYTGGANIADEYINVKSRFGVWKDNAIRVVGKAVYGYTLLFLATWHCKFDGKSEIDYNDYKPEKYIDEIGGFPISNDLVLPYGDIPYGDHPAGEGTYLSILGSAKHYVYMTSPYLIPTGKLITQMIQASMSGVDVRLITPGIPDKKLVYELTRFNYGRLLKEGVRIFEFSEGFIHAKTFLSDDTLATVGTINLDYRSLYLHSENGTLLLGKNIVAPMKEDFEKTLNRCHEVTLEEWKKWRRKKGILWGFLRLIAPFL